MAKRRNATTSNDPAPASSTRATSSTADALEQRIVAFAEQLGRLAGTVQAKAEGWLDPEALKQQMSGIRDGAAELIAQLAGGKADDRAADEPARTATPQASRTRSGGKVDAPGKKHRKPTPSDPAVSTARNRVMKMKTPRTRATAGKRRGRG